MLEPCKYDPSGAEEFPGEGQASFEWKAGIRAEAPTLSRGFEHQTVQAPTERFGPSLGVVILSP
jgi:hypothetical protein